MGVRRYRGKQIGTKEWIYGSLLYPVVGGTPYIIQDAYIDDSGNLDFRYYPVDLDTVGQCTGWLSSTGMQIFKGDICQIAGEDGLFEVVWIPEEAMYGLNGNDLILTFDSFYPCDISIVGNVHDNPELLEVEK